MTRRKTGRRRSPVVGTAIALALLASACGDDATIATTIPPSTTAVASTTTTGAADLSSAIAAVGSRYRFVASVSLNGTETTRVEGLLTDGTGRYLVTNAGTQVEYIVGPAGQWARQGDAPWTVLGGPAPVADPLAQLASPTTLTQISSSADGAVITATYPATALGFAGEGEVRVALTIAGGVLAEIRYSAPVGTSAAVVVTTITPDPFAPPVTTP